MRTSPSNKTFFQELQSTLRRTNRAEGKHGTTTMRPSGCLAVSHGFCPDQHAVFTCHMDFHEGKRMPPTGHAGVDAAFHAFHGLSPSVCVLLHPFAFACRHPARRSVVPWADPSAAYGRPSRPTTRRYRSGFPEPTGGKGHPNGCQRASPLFLPLSAESLAWVHFRIPNTLKNISQRVEKYFPTG